MISELFTKYQFCAKHTANNTAGNVAIRPSFPQIPICSVDYTRPSVMASYTGARRHSGSYCAAIGCSNRWSQKKEKHFHRFPKDPDR